MALAVKDAVAADANKNLCPARFCRFREVDDFRHVRQVVAGERNDIWPPALQQAIIGTMILNLQIDDLDFVPGSPHRLRDEFESQRLEPQEHLRVEQRAGMDTEKAHG